MTYTHQNKGVCSTKTTVTIEDGVIQQVTVDNGCDGNLKGICALLPGMTPEQAAQRLQGITCGRKATSCPDQIAKCLLEAAQQIIIPT